VKQKENLEPDVHYAMSFGQQMRNENTLSEVERREVDEDMDEMQKRYDKLKKDASDQHEW
jgi:hypothetical protein